MTEQLSDQAVVIEPAPNERAWILGIVFSRDRAMQLDATLRSFHLHCQDADAITLHVIYKTTNQRHAKQYAQLAEAYAAAGTVHFVEETDFRQDVVRLLVSHGAKGQAGYILFLVDDNIFVRDFRLCEIRAALADHPQAAAFSLRLGANTTYQYSYSQAQVVPTLKPVREHIRLFDWTTARGDFNYPLEVSSSVFRSDEMTRLLDQLPFKNPNTLEASMQDRRSMLRANHRFLLCYEQSVAFCNPVNKVQTVFATQAGAAPEYAADHLAELFDQGYRIRVDAYAGFEPNACHQEVELLFEQGLSATPIETPDKVRQAQQSDRAMCDATELAAVPPIPNVFHFIFFRPDNPEIPFSLVHYLAIKSAFEVNHPDVINLYYSNEGSGEWWEKAKPYVNLVRVEPPNQIFGQPLHHYAHQADVLRLQLLIEQGGVYLDMDVICTKPFTPLLQYPFVLGQEGEGGDCLCNGVMLSQKNAPFAQKWLAGFDPKTSLWEGFRSEGRDNYWAEYSVLYPAHLAKLFPELVHIESHNKFHWPLWDDAHLKWLFEENSDSFETSYCHHLWETLSWEKYLRDLTVEYITRVDTNFNRIARRFLEQPKRFPMQFSSSAAGRSVDLQAAPIVPEAEASLSALVVYQSPVAKVRLGTDTDGGYVICDHLGPYNLLLSGGIGGNDDFEIDFIDKYRADCYAFDPNIDNGEQKSPRLTFIKKSIGPISSEYSSNLKEYMSQSDDIFLKLDIEGGEFAWISALSTEELLKFKQIVIEIHDLFERDYSESSSFLGKLTANHVLVHLHANNWRGTVNVGGIAVPEVFECTFIRKDCYPPPLIPNQDSIPSAFDRPNLSTSPDICLSGWPFVPVCFEIADEQTRRSITSMKITAYSLSDQAAAIEPAPNERAWATEVGAVAADLALGTAGGKGWELRCPYAFEATWNGGPNAEDIDIRIEAPDADAPAFVQSRLGQGLLTFYPGYQFKTEDEQVLWVRGPINMPKDGLYPLEQIVDTSLLPCTINVTWKFTRPNQTIRFAAGEPFGTILPYAKSAQENVTLDVVQLDIDAELDAYERAFQELADSAAVQDVFQRMGAVAAEATPPDQAQGSDSAATANTWAAQLTDPPPVTCICPTYGRVALLEEAIESFLRQDYPGPKELIVLNDYEGQTLEFDHPDVRVINVPRRFHSVGEKYKAAAALASHDLIFVWHDDDIYLPHRLSYSVTHLDAKKAFFKADKAWFWNGGKLSGPDANLFHGGSCWRRELFVQVQGYPHIGNRYDLEFEQLCRSAAPTAVHVQSIKPVDIYYLYRWQATGSYHFSTMGTDGQEEGKVVGYVAGQATRGEIPLGQVQLQPQWKSDYGVLVQECLTTMPAAKREAHEEEIAFPPPFFVIPPPAALPAEQTDGLFRGDYPLKISVILPASNESVLLQRTVEQFAATLPEHSEIIVVDNGSTDGSADFLLEAPCPNIHLISTPEALGVAQARNRGLAAAQGEIVVFADAHIDLPTDWWQPIVCTLNRPNVGVVGPGIGVMGKPELSAACGQRIAEAKLRVEWLSKQADEPYPVPTLGGGFMAMRHDTLKQAGAFDAGMPQWGSEDLEICMRYWLLGYEVWVAPAVTILHYFRRANPYKVEWGAITHNLLRVALLHLSQARLARVMAALKSDVKFEHALAHAVESDVWQKRADFTARRVRDDDWLFAKFADSCQV